MALTDERAPSSPAQQIPPLPDARRLAGPRARARMQRTFAVVGAVWAIGLALALWDPSDEATAFGLGLLVPGGGFLYTGNFVLAPVFAVGCLLAFLVFWLFSPLWLPILVALGGAAFAAAAADGGTEDWARWVVPAGLAALVLAGMALRHLSLRSMRRDVVERNRHLAGRTWTPPVRDADPELGPPLSDEDLAYQRVALDMALQPLDRFDGFATLDQFREAAWRYQLNTLGWALALSQYTHTPAFSGYLAEAQRNAITKMLHPKVWRYWRWENLLGNLRWDPDPVRRDNIMFSGFFAAHLGAFETVTGDLRFSAPDALTFADRKASYRYDYGSLVATLRTNLDNAALCMFPCEPNWVYPHCNEMAMTGLLMHDRLHGTDYAQQGREEFECAVLEEFATPDDRVLNMRSSRLGIAMPGLAKSTLTEADSAWLLSPIMPAVAARRWELVRRWLTVRDGRLHIDRLGGFDRVDVGNYKMPTMVFTLATIMIAARELGDDEIYRATKETLDADYNPTLRDDALHIDASPFTALLATMARLGRRHAWHDLTNRDLPASWRTGPRLAEAAYPDVLVAQAGTDGRALQLELAPGAGGGRVTLVLDRLVPGAGYRVEGGLEPSVVADGDGRARITADLPERRRLTISPEA